MPDFWIALPHKISQQTYLGDKLTKDDKKAALQELLNLEREIQTAIQKMQKSCDEMIATIEGIKAKL